MKKQMAKKSKRLAVRYEKDQSGCMWGLISLFDFRHGRSSRKLIADKKRVSRHPVGVGNSRNKFEILANLDEDSIGTLESEECKKADVGKPSVKKLIEEEMFSELDAKRTEFSGNLKTDRKTTKKNRRKSCDMDANSLPADENRKEQTVDNLPVDEILTEICSQIHRTSTAEMMLDEDDKANECLGVLEEKVAEAIKEYLHRKFDIGKDFTEVQRKQQLKEIMDSLQIPHSDEELFFELAKNPNSILLKYIRSLHDSLPEKVEKAHEFSEVKDSNEHVNHKHHIFFRRKVKNHARNQSNGDGNSDPLSKIVILKPGPQVLENSEQKSTRKVSSERAGSNFSLAELKRKFKHAIGKDQHELSTDGSGRLPSDRRSMRESEKGVMRENAARNSTTKDHFFMERIARPSIDGKKAGKLKDLETSQDFGNRNHNSKGLANIYVEAKKHLSEMLSSGDEGIDFLSGHVPKTLGRILSLPEYSLSPINSPRKDKNSSMTPEMRFSAGFRLSNGKEILLSPKAKNNGNPISSTNDQFCISENNSKNVQSDDIIDENRRGDTASCSKAKDGTTSEGNIEISKANERNVSDAPSLSSGSSPFREDRNGVIPDTVPLTSDEKSVTDVSSDPTAYSLTREDENCDSPIPDLGNCEETFKSLTQDSSEENQLPLSPSRSPSSFSAVQKAVEDLDGVSDAPERPSPVSVLEPLFVDDNVSPVHGRSQPAELPIQPVNIQFEDHEHAENDKANGQKQFKEDKEVIFDYIKAVLLASRLNWNEICIKWLSSEQLLDSSLIDEVAFFPNQLSRDQQLLFDCINEVLADICLSHPPWLSFVKPCLRSILDWEEDVNEVCNGVFWHLLPLPQPLTLDHLVRKDMSRARTWMNLHSGTETIGIETCEAIFDDLVEDTIFCFVNDSSDSDDRFHTENGDDNDYSIKNSH